MKLLLADDEAILREGLAAKIRGMGLPVDVAGEAENGRDALALARSLKPDVVLTDIRMPGLDGLSLIEELARLDGSIRCVIVSGYDDFEYAKRAMRFGVTDYLLKPIDEDELRTCLSRLAEELAAERRRLERLDELASAGQAGMEKLRQHMLTKFIQQGESAPEAVNPAAGDEQLLRLKGRYPWFAAAVFQLKPFALPHYSFRPEDEELLWFAVKNMISESGGAGRREGLLFRHAVRDYELVYVIGLHTRDETLAVGRWLEEVLRGIREYLKLDLAIAIGFPVDRVERIPQSYQQASQEIRNRILHGSNRIYASPGQPRGTDRRSLLTDEEKRMLEIWLKEGDPEPIHRWITRRIGAIAQDPSSTFVQLEWFCIDLYLLLSKYLFEHSPDTEWVLGDRDDLTQWLRELTGWRESIEQMKRHVEAIFAYLRKSERDAGYDVMDEVKRYMHERFAEPLSLQHIAERFYIHPNYFSRRFKEKFGEGFVDYLTDIRMRKAAEWLREDRFKIHQIAELVGFENATYFGTVFRKKFGVTPSQYREGAAEGSPGSE